ncbi:bactofilin family protein [Paenibacillus crassostreae]|uniref:Cell division protein n=1 Tax=Paenibacillus crassostreae TaxID=1763538 RepID=A0A167AHK7_9BACL|nr:polymer-forming cytoskeletal protein [Paenibacillus crassostreae]AOZ92313.1 cell division protein [Paenibacillus crassostreae]OAB71030.1 cell division protein [Paenibacillus crassostreae]
MTRSRRNNKQNKTMDTLIGQGSEMTGKLHCESNLRIEGKFNGEIESQGEVVVGENAVARSNIQAKEVIIAGKVYGDIAAAGRLTITPTGHMFGDVSATSLIIMEGGSLSGTSTMNSTTESETSKDIDSRFLQSEVS